MSDKHTLDIQEIMNRLPHRYPFLLVDRILDLQEDRVVGLKNVTYNEPFFQGHFPQEPVMPGVLILEAMGQVAAMMVLHLPGSEHLVPYLTGVDHAKFRRPVRPGDQLITEGQGGAFPPAGGKGIRQGHRGGGSRGGGRCSVFFWRNGFDAKKGEALMVTVHPTAIVSPKAQIEEGVQIGPYCIVGDRVHIRKGTVLEAFVRICDYVEVGENCRFFEHVTLGREPQDFDFKGEESWVILEKDVVLRENVTIHRASGEGKATRVGEGCYIMEGCHLGHNVELGPRVVMANKAGLSGYVHVGEKTVIGGMAGVHQFVHIGRNCMVGGLSKIVKDVPPFLLVDGHPARVYGLNKVGASAKWLQRRRSGGCGSHLPEDLSRRAPYSGGSGPAPGKNDPMIWPGDSRFCGCRKRQGINPLDPVLGFS